MKTKQEYEAEIALDVITATCLFLTASGIGGGLTSLYSNNEINLITVLLGILMAATFAVLADYTLKYNRYEWG